MRQLKVHKKTLILIKNQGLVFRGTKILNFLYALN